MGIPNQNTTICHISHRVYVKVFQSEGSILEIYRQLLLQVSRGQHMPGKILLVRHVWSVCSFFSSQLNQQGLTNVYVNSFKWWSFNNYEGLSSFFHGFYLLTDVSIFDVIFAFSHGLTGRNIYFEILKIDVFFKDILQYLMMEILHGAWGKI